MNDMKTTSKLYTLTLCDVRTYFFSFLFITGNILLPQLCHLIPQGGPTLLPIYFFTLIGAYKFGLRVGLLTAVLSPLLNSILFGMPAFSVLPVLLVKSVLLALAASVVAHYSPKITVWGLLIAILFYQLIGTAFEWAWCSNFALAIQDFRVGMPGLLLQWFGGYLLLKALERI